MASYRIEVKRSAIRELRQLPANIAARIWPHIRALAANPRPRGTTKLSGEVDAYRIRVGDYRVLYEVYDQQRLVSVRQVRHRREAYR
jgi:mRNA interferase RelE/StbE